MSGQPNTSPLERFLGVSPFSGDRSSAAHADAPMARPFIILGLDPSRCTDEHILASLERQLDRVAQHPEGDTPEADEVRLALHASAAQLLDRNVRAHLLDRQGVTSADLRTPPTTGERPIQARPHAPVVAPGQAFATPRPSLPHASLLLRLEQDAVLTLGRYGGWNQKSLRRLAQLATARGLTSQDLVMTLHRLATRRRRAPANPQALRPTQRPRLEPTVDAAARDEAAQREDPGQLLLKRIALFGTVALLALAVMLGVIISLAWPGESSSGPVPPAPPSGGSNPSTPAITAADDPAMKSDPADARAAPSDEPAAFTPPVRSDALARLHDPNAVLRLLQDSSERLRADSANAGEQFELACTALMQQWCRYNDAQLIAATSAVVQFVFDAQPWPDIRQHAMDVIESGAAPLSDPSVPFMPDRVWPAAWSAGMLTRLSHERDLMAETAARVSRALTGALEGDRPFDDRSFGAGATAAVRRMTPRLLDPAIPPDRIDDTIGQWVAAADAAVRRDPDRRERLLVDAAEHVLMQGSSPQSDRAAFAVLQRVITEIRWRRGGVARLRLLDWLRDPRIPTESLHVVTSVMAAESSAEGFDARMVLSSGASASDRRALRERLSQAWGVENASRTSPAVQAWAAEAGRALEASLADGSSLESLLMSARLALLNDAAASIWRGDTGVATAFINESKRTDALLRSDKAARPSANLATGSVPGDGAWTVSFKQAERNIPLRIAALEQLETSLRAGAALGPVDAEVLAEVACFGPGDKVRAAAMRAASFAEQQPAFINALIEIAPRMPKIDDVSEMVQRASGRPLPPVRDAAWRIDARRVLVERLLEIIADSSEQASIDAISGLLAASYERRASASSNPDPTDAVAPADAADAAVAAASSWWASLRAEADSLGSTPYAPFTPQQLDARRRGRLALAAGPVQRFAANQTSLPEIIAFIAIAERPSLAPPARSALDELAESRRRARHIFDQIKAAERAMLRLWIARLTENSA